MGMGMWHMRVEEQGDVSREKRGNHHYRMLLKLKFQCSFLSRDFMFQSCNVRLSLETKFARSQQKQQDSINEKCPEYVHANNLYHIDSVFGVKLDELKPLGEIGEPS